MSHDYSSLPAGLPEPKDDGAADHLAGMPLPRVALPSSSGGMVSLSELPDLAVAYVHSRTGRPDESLPAGWDDIPGARGCTPQSCAYRDSLAEFEALRATVVGISAQSPEEQLEFAEREHIPFPLLSDSSLQLASTLRLPTFEAGGMTLYKRLTFVAEGGRIVKVFYPVFPPDRDPGEALSWLRRRAELTP